MLRWLLVFSLALVAYAAEPPLELVGEFTIKGRDSNVGTVGRCCFSPDESSVAVEAGQVNIIDLKTKEVKPSEGSQLLAWLPSGLCYRDREGWVYRGNQRLLRLPWTREHTLTTTEGNLLAVMAGDKRSQARLWNLASGDRLGEWDIPWPIVKAGAGTGRWLAALIPGGEAGIWDLSNHRELTKFSERSDNVAMAFTPDRSLLITATRPNDQELGGQLAARNSRSGEQVADIATPPRGGSDALAVAPSGTLVAVGVAESVVLWDIPGKKLLERPATTRGTVDWLAFSPSGKLVAATSRPSKDDSKRLLKVWRVP